MLKDFESIFFVVIIFSCLFFPFQAGADITTGLKDYYPFEEGTGTVTADLSGNSNDGILENNPVWTTGRIGSYALDFNGVDLFQFVSSPINLTSYPITQCAWVNPRSIPSGLSAVVTTNFLSTYLSWSGLGYPYGFSLENIDGGFGGGASFDFTLNNWHHVCTTIDADYTYHIYLDGTEIGSGPFQNSSFFFGQFKIGGGRYSTVDGKIDDVRIYDRSLSPSDVIELYNYAGPPDITPPVISSIASSTTDTSATIEWNTNETATSTVRYGLTSSYGLSSSSQSSVINHSINLTGLTTGSPYHFQIVTTDSAGNTATSSDKIFTTYSVASSGGEGCSTSYSYDFTNGIVTTNTCGRSATSTILGFKPATTTTSIITPNIIVSTSTISTSKESDGDCLPGYSFNTATGKKCPSVITVAPTFIYTRDLTLNSVGQDVRNLQEDLNTKGFIVSLNGAGSPGLESNFFGTKTQQALARFQKANGIVPAAGYFGKITRKFFEGLR